ncbi:MAG: DnaJ domain-containing protein, partial [Planctomycetota bacterium]
MPQDYYETLGVKRDASDDAISKAYRDMARKHHPDLNPGDAKAKQKFQDVQLAFEVLGNKEKRAKYDRFGPGFESMGGGQGWPGGGPHPGGPGGAPFNVDLGDLFGNGRGGAGAGGSFADLFKQFSAGRGPAPGGPRGPGGSRAAPARGADMTHEITVP